MRPSHAFIQKRQTLLSVLLVILYCALSGCTREQGVGSRQRIAPSCEQQCGTSLDCRTFACIDRCHIEADRTSLPRLLTYLASRKAVR